MDIPFSKINFPRTRMENSKSHFENDINERFDVIIDTRIFIHTYI